MILRGCGRGEPGQHFAVVPGHPLRWTSLQLLGVPPVQVAFFATQRWRTSCSLRS
jgi:hypothetical protein